MKKPFFTIVAGILIAAATVALATGPIPVKVVVVTMFEQGADTGDTPGEFQFWVEREHLDCVIPFPQGYHDLRMNADQSVLGVVTGMGSVRSAATIMALGLDPRFDLTHAYWLVAGIAGIDPADASIGSAAWSEWLVDGDLAHEIDAREMPSQWPTGYIPLFAKEPYELPVKSNDGNAYQLDPGLVEWAYQLTKDTPLADTAALQSRRAPYVNTPNAQRPPFVLKGDNLSSMTFWHGKLMNGWANQWVSYYSNGTGNYVTTEMEDSGTAQSLTWLARAGKVDVRRLLVLRTASNFDSQWPGGTALESLTGEQHAAYSAYIPSLEAAYQVGSQVVHALLANWDQYATEIPQAGN